MWQLGCEGSLGENGYMYVYDWVPSLFTWNYHEIVNWLYPNTKCIIVNWLCVYAKSPQSCPTLCYAADCSLPGSSVHRILQARILEWVAILFSRGSSWPRDQTHVSCISCLSDVFFTIRATREAEWDRMDIHICIAKSLCFPPKTITTLIIGYTPI